MLGWCPSDLLPGLWVASLATLAVLLLHRHFDRIPASAAVVFAAALGAAFGPVLFGGKVLLPLDSLRGRTPFLELAPTEPHGNPLQGDLLQLVAPAGAEVRRAVAAGRWPLWNDRAGAGMPLLADPQAQALQPLVLAALPFDVPRAAGVTAALRVFVALLFMLLLLRRLGLCTGAALFGSLAWGLGAFLFLWLGWPLASSGAWLPAILYAGSRAVDRGGRRDGLLFLAAAWGLATAGHPETILYSLLLTGAFLAVRVRAVGSEQRRRALRRAGASLLLAGGLAAPALLPAFAYLPQTLRASRLADPHPAPVAEGSAERARLRLLPLAAPNAFGNDRYLDYWGPDNINEDASGFVGTAALLLALSGLATPWRRRRREEKLLLAAAAIGLAVVAQAPGAVELLTHLPGGGASGFHHRLLLLVGFALAVLAACELDRRGRGEGRAWPLLTAAAGLAGILAWAYLAFPHPEAPERLEVLRIGWLHWQGRVLVLSTLLLLASSLPPLARWWPRRPWLAWGLCALAAAELLLLHLPAQPAAPQRLAFPRTPALAFLEQHLAAGERLSGIGSALLPHLASVYGLADARLAGPMAPAPYLRAAAPVIAGWEGEMASFAAPEHPFYDLLGVRLVLAPPAAQAPPALQTVFADGSGTVWRRPRALPRLFLPLAAERQDPGTWAERLAGIGDFAALALAEELPGDGEAGRESWRAELPEAGDVELLEASPSRLAARARAPESRLLVASIYQDGGWRLLVDGRRHRTARADGPFLGAWLPAGSHRLTLLYRPGSFLAGSLLAALALALVLAWLLPPPLPKPAAKG